MMFATLAGDFYKLVFVVPRYGDPRPASVAGPVSHEVGHSFGLNHDGRNSSSFYEEYFSGHGQGNHYYYRWGPIMGVGV